MSHLDDNLSAYLDDELEPAERTRTAAHLEECGACRIELDRIAEARSALRDLPLLEAPVELLGHQGRSRAGLRRIRPVWAWAAAAAGAAALVVSLVVAPGRPGSNIDLDTMADHHVARVVFEPGFATVRAVVEQP